MNVCVGGREGGVYVCVVGVYVYARTVCECIKVCVFVQSQSKVVSNNETFLNGRQR